VLHLSAAPAGSDSRRSRSRHPAQLRTSSTPPRALLAEPAQLRPAEDSRGGLSHTSPRLATAWGRACIRESRVEGGVAGYWSTMRCCKRCHPFSIHEAEFHEAAKRGDAAELKRLVRGGADAGAKDGAGDSPLHHAAHNGHEAACAVLMQRGADVGVKDRGGYTPLHDAAQNGHEAACAVLMRGGADVRAGDRDGDTPLHCAAYNGHKAACVALVQRGADVKAKDKSGNTPADDAERNGHATLARLLRNPRRGGVTQCTPRARRGDHASAKPAAKASWNPGTPRPTAENGDAAGATGSSYPLPATRLSPAASRPSSPGAGTPAPPPSPAAKAIGTWNLQPGGGGGGTVLQPKKLAAPAPAPTIAGRYALHEAARRGDAAEVERLVRSGADVGAKDEYGYTPLHHAAESGHEAICVALVQRGADVRAKDRGGDTPADDAERRGHAALARLLCPARGAKAKGNAAMSARDFEEAVAAYTEAIGHDGSDKVFYSNRSAAYARMGKWNQALADGRKCVELEPSFAKGYDRAGAALHGQGEYQEAVDIYKKGLEVDSSNAMLNQGLSAAQAALRAAAVAKAEELATQAKLARRSALHEAARRGDAAEVERLVRSGADVGAKDRDGVTPLHHAAHNGHEAICAALVRAGADAGAKGRFGERVRRLPPFRSEGDTPADDAERAGHAALARQLRTSATRSSWTQSGGLRWPPTTAAPASQSPAATSAAAAPLAPEVLHNGVSARGAASLHEAAQRGDAAELKRLVRGGADVGAKDRDGDTPLHRAAYKGHEAACAALLRSGADFEASWDGDTPADHAERAGHAALARLLRDSAWQKASPAQASGSAAALPPGWAVHSDTETGRTFYFHARSGRSQWEPPSFDPAWPPAATATAPAPQFSAAASAAAAPLAPGVLQQAENICRDFMAHSGGVPKEPAERLQRGEQLLEGILVLLSQSGIPVGHADLCQHMEKVCGWLQSCYIDGGEPREKRRALARRCDELVNVGASQIIEEVD
jgi:ankyrin repeat protein